MGSAATVISRADDCRGPELLGKVEDCFGGGPGNEGDGLERRRTPTVQCPWPPDGSPLKISAARGSVCLYSSTERTRNAAGRPRPRPDRARTFCSRTAGRSVEVEDVLMPLASHRLQPAADRFEGYFRHKGRKALEPPPVLHARVASPVRRPGQVTLLGKSAFFRPA